MIANKCTFKNVLCQRLEINPAVSVLGGVWGGGSFTPRAFSALLNIFIHY